MKSFKHFFAKKFQKKKRQNQPVKIKESPLKVEVLMGKYSTVTDDSVLFTESLTECSALVVLSDMVDNIYQIRTLMHLQGSSIDHGLCDDKSSQKLINEQYSKLQNGGKVLWISGACSGDHRYILGQESSDGRQPLLDLLTAPRVDSVIASSSGVTIHPNGNFELSYGGEGEYNEEKKQAILKASRDA